MRSSRRSLRMTGFGLAALLGAFIVMSEGPAEPATEIGAASVTVSGDSARVVENVVYRQDVTRLGDVVVVDGAPAAPITDPTVAAVWAIVDSTWPTSQRGELRQLSVIEEDERGLVGVVHPSVAGGWILSLDAADLGDPDLLRETIVHELAHVVTLGPAVFTFGDVACGGESIGLGCAHDGTVLADFVAAFWADREAGPADEYVNDYAASAPHEDLAETFTSMVWGWTPSGEVIDAKVAMLAADPGLVDLAVEIRALLDAAPAAG
ncbi:MAG: hypothetical protein AAGA90_18050 [Actinomycetota bacterium]